MKKTGLILLIYGFWLLVSGYYTNTYSQDETLTLLTYYPAPYGVYQKLDIMSSSWDKIDLVTTGSNYEMRIASDNNAMNITANARWTGSAWTRDSTTSPSLAYLQHIDNSQHEFRVRNAGDPASPFWTTAMVIETDGQVGIGTTNPTNKLHVVGRNDAIDDVVFMPGSDTADAGTPSIRVGIGTTSPLSDKLDIVTTVNSLNDRDSDIPILIRRSDNTNNRGTGIGFACTAGTGIVGAKIVHERKGLNSQGDLVFYTKSGSGQDTLDERMRIDQDGDVTFKNMPGIAYKNYIIKDWNPTAGTGFPTTAWNTSLNWRDVDSITIQIPAMGYILVQSSGNIGTYFQSNEAALYYMSVGISGISNTGPISSGADASARMEVTGGGAAGPNQRFPYSCATVYPITDTDVTNGSKTFYIVATMTCTGNGSRRLIVNGSVQAMFFPAEYNP